MRTEKKGASYFLVLTSYFLFLAFCLSGCAPKVAPPPLYRGIGLSIEEIIQRSANDINALKAIADINIEKNSEPFSFISASALIKSPGESRMRLYKLGVPVNDILIKDDKVRILSGKSNGMITELGREFYHAVFWWEGMRNGVMRKEGHEYILTADNKEIHLDSETLFPLRQHIITEGKDIAIEYSEPKKEGSFWYPSSIDIAMGSYIVKVRVKKLLLNPQIVETDFRAPALY